MMMDDQTDCTPENKYESGSLTSSVVVYWHGAVLVRFEHGCVGEMRVLGAPVGLDAMLKYAARAPAIANDSGFRDPGSNVGFAATISGVPLTGRGPEIQRAEMSARNLTFEKRVRNTPPISLVDDALQAAA